jgi:hypothetical protein
MGDAEELNLLRETYERALVSYEAVCSTLNRQFAAGMRPSAEELEQERNARLELDAARRAYLEAWMLP